MAVQSRQPDFVASYINLEKRVSNLETGVHATTASVGYKFTAPELVDATGSLTHGSPVVTYSYRNGLVVLGGIIHGSSLEAITGGGSTFGTLPAAARPSVSTTQLVALDVAPYWTALKVQTNGQIVVLPTESGSGSFNLSCDSVVFAVG